MKQLGTVEAGFMRTIFVRNENNREGHLKLFRKRNFSNEKDFLCYLFAVKEALKDACI